MNSVNISNIILVVHSLSLSSSVESNLGCRSCLVVVVVVGIVVLKGGREEGNVVYYLTHMYSL